ncbi:hypothetical protein EG329_003283 [Mollisiaceae sp. DMI_Dod_QoI]|nr:hypothetical protein EG329_003283 [Helotiales sp. DMI_Dod_QoI]
MGSGSPEKKLRFRHSWDLPPRWYVEDTALSPACYNVIAITYTSYLDDVSTTFPRTCSHHGCLLKSSR